MVHASGPNGARRGGFYKFGSRTRLVGADEKPLGESVALVQKKYEPLCAIFADKRYDSAVCFFEFFGQHSWFGTHDLNELHDVVLFDIAPYKRGILEPDDFIRLVDEQVEIAPVLYYGKANQTLIDQVKTATLPGMPFEGVVCKGKNDKKTKMPIMFKIKNEAWYAALRKHCHGDEKLFESLA